jgi:iron complex transport system substrate-binding protein
MFRKITFILFSLALLVSACASPTQAALPTQVTSIEPSVTPALSVEPSATPAPAGLSFTDGMGRVVKLAGPAQKIISTAPSNTEILFAVGAGAQVIGRDDFSDFPAQAKNLPSIGGMNKYNLEQIAALKPDLVLMAEINSPEQVKSIEDLGITVFYLSNPKTLEDMYHNLQLVASLTSHEQDATALIEKLKTRVIAIDEKVKAAAAKPVIFYELDSTDPAKPYTAGTGTFVDQLIVRAGGANLTTAAGIKDSYPQVSIEQVVSTNPDMIVLGDSMWGVTPESVGQRPGWDKLKAVTGKQVIPFDDNLVSRPGPRLVEGLEILAKLIHPELFK